MVLPDPGEFRELFVGTDAHPEGEDTDIDGEVDLSRFVATRGDEVRGVRITLEARTIIDHTYCGKTVRERPHSD